MATKLESFFFEKNEGLMNRDEFINYKSQRSLNNSFFSIRSKRETNDVRFCLVKGDILNLDVSCIVNFYEHGKKSNNSLFKKAGKLYEDHFNNELLKNLSNLSIKNYSLFLSLSGNMTNCEYILNLIYKSKIYPERNREIFRTLFEIYSDIFEIVNTSKLKSLAIPFIIVDNNFEISIKALIQAIIFLTESSNSIFQYLKYIYLISDDDEILKKCDNLATNGFDLEYIILKDHKQTKRNSTIGTNSQKKESNKTIILNKTENFVNFYNYCGVCKVNSLLISNFLNDEFLKNCSNYKRNCKICRVCKHIALFYRKNRPTNSDTFCIYCVCNLIDKKKYHFCSSCLRITDKTQMRKNKYCAKEFVCLKCSNLPQNIKNCFICELFVLFQKLEENKMILNHDQLSCCFDYCNLSEMNLENIKSLSCGHKSCLKIVEMSKLCSLCSITKLIDSLNQEL